MSRIKSTLFLIVLPIFLGCTSPGSNGDSSSNESFATPTPTPSPTPSPTPQICSEEEMSEGYNTTVTMHSVNQNDIATACVDSSAPYQVNIGFASSDIFMNVRFQTTCSTRWCNQHLGENTSVGVMTSATQWNGAALDLTASVPIQCRSSNPELVVNACSQETEVRVPLENFTLSYNDSRCGFCGCDHLTVGNKWSTSKQALIDCGTAFCKAENNGFHWGILSEANVSLYIIRCSRADVE